MNLPDFWGKGSLFAFSGLDGENSYWENVTGTLCGDRIGILFHTAARRELFFEFTAVRNFEYEIVASDIIRMELCDGEGKAVPLIVVFYSQDTVIGITAECAMPVIQCESPFQCLEEDGVRIHHTEKNGSGEYSALCCRQTETGVLFALSFSKTSAEKAKRNVCAAIKLDIFKEAEHKMEFYYNLPRPLNRAPLVEKTLYRCFSVMKTQVYTPEGIFKTRWTTPDRLPHKNLWLWDSVFHSLGNRYISKELALESLLAVLASQREDGFIPLMAAPPDERTELTQPPLLAWGFYKYYMPPDGRNNAPESRIIEIYNCLGKYLEWNMHHRDSNGNLLFEWKVTRDSITNRCGESGMDNSTRFDNVVAMECIDFSCFMANEARCMAQLAEMLGLKEDSEYWSEIFEKIKKQMNEKLWDEGDGFYYDRVLETDSLKKVKAVSSFLPLYAGVCEKHHAERLVKHLTDTGSFNTELPIPSIAANDPSYEADMWRGPVWINYNYLIIQGLKEYGYNRLAAEITEKTINAIAFWYMHDGCIYEYFDCRDRISPARLNRKGRNLNPFDLRIRIQNVRDFGWTAALFTALVFEE